MCDHEEVLKQIVEIKNELKILNGKVAANTRGRFLIFGGLAVIVSVVLPLLGVLLALTI